MLIMLAMAASQTIGWEKATFRDKMGINEGANGHHHQQYVSIMLTTGIHLGIMSCGRLEGGASEESFVVKLYGEADGPGPSNEAASNTNGFYAGVMSMYQDVTDGLFYTVWESASWIGNIFTDIVSCSKKEGDTWGNNVAFMFQDEADVPYHREWEGMLTSTSINTDIKGFGKPEGDGSDEKQ
ncbi:rbcL [Symbiodinium sp. CCMP2592]|nr:rbcL [Symbiodinium sp. CCMP2592]